MAGTILYLCIKLHHFKGCFFLQFIYINTKLLNIKNVILFVAKKMQVY